MQDPVAAAHYLRERRRSPAAQKFATSALTSTNNVAVRVDDVVEGGRVLAGYDVGTQGVVVGHQTRLGQVSIDRPMKNEQGQELRRTTSDGKRERVWHREDDVVQGIVLLRKNEHSLPALRDVEAKVEELNGPDSGRLLPGVKLEPYYDRMDLMNLTRETVNENLITGMVLVSTILLLFLNNVRTALIVAINIPLASAVRLRRVVSCAASRPICCRSGRSTLGSSSIPRSSWSRIFIAR